MNDYNKLIVTKNGNDMIFDFGNGMYKITAKNPIVEKKLIEVVKSITRDLTVKEIEKIVMPYDKEHSYLGIASWGDGCRFFDCEIIYFNEYGKKKMTLEHNDDNEKTELIESIGKALADLSFNNNKDYKYYEDFKIRSRKEEDKLRYEGYNRKVTRSSWILFLVFVVVGACVFVFSSLSFSVLITILCAIMGGICLFVYSMNDIEESLPKFMFKDKRNIIKDFEEYEMYHEEWKKVIDKIIDKRVREMYKKKNEEVLNKLNKQKEQIKKSNLYKNYEKEITDLLLIIDRIDKDINNYDTCRFANYYDIIEKEIEELIKTENIEKFEAIKNKFYDPFDNKDNIEDVEDDDVSEQETISSKNVLSDLRSLSRKIEDSPFKEQVEESLNLIKKIPKENRTDRLVNFYIPTEIELINNYLALGNDDTKTKEEIKKGIEKLNKAYAKMTKTDNSYEKMKIKSNLDVLDSVLIADGLQDELTF